MGQIYCNLNTARRNTEDTLGSTPPASENSNRYDENFIDKVSSASYAAGIDRRQSSQINGTLKSSEPFDTEGEKSFAGAKHSSTVSSEGSDQNDESAIDKVSSASYAAGIEFENEDQVGESTLARCSRNHILGSLQTEVF